MSSSRSVVRMTRPSTTSGLRSGWTKRWTLGNRNASQSTAKLASTIVATSTIPFVIELYCAAIAFCAASAISTNTSRSLTVTADVLPRRTTRSSRKIEK